MSLSSERRQVIWRSGDEPAGLKSRFQVNSYQPVTCTVRRRQERERGAHPLRLPGSCNPHLLPNPHIWPICILMYLSDRKEEPRGCVCARPGSLMDIANILACKTIPLAPLHPFSHGAITGQNQLLIGLRYLIRTAQRAA